MLTAMGDVMREAYRRGWITTRDGNVSVRMGKYFYITPSAVRKNTIQPENIVKLYASTLMDHKPGDYVPGGISIEFDMHWMVQQANKAKSVVHLHPPYTVAAMHAKWDLADLAEKFVELGRYTKVGDNVDFYPPGSQSLATYTAEYITGKDLVGQEGHGVTACGANPWEAFEHIERMEHICQIVLASGVKPNEK
jgi:L-fuculose-phosphate aldolase